MLPIVKKKEDSATTYGVGGVWYWGLVGEYW